MVMMGKFFGLSKGQYYYGAHAVTKLNICLYFFFIKTFIKLKKI